MVHQIMILPLRNHIKSSVHICLVAPSFFALGALDAVGHKGLSIRACTALLSCRMTASRMTPFRTVQTNACV